MPAELIVAEAGKGPLDFINRKKSDESPELLRARSFLIMSRYKSYNVTAIDVAEREHWMNDISRVAR